MLRQPNPLDLKESFAEFHASTEVKGNMVVTQRRLLIKANEVTPEQLASYKAFQKAISDNHSLAIFLHVPADVPASGPVSTPSRTWPRSRAGTPEPHAIPAYNLNSLIQVIALDV